MPPQPSGHGEGCGVIPALPWLEISPASCAGALQPARSPTPAASPLCAQRSSKTSAGTLGKEGLAPPKVFPKGAFPKHPKEMWSEGWCPTHERCGHAPARLPQDILLRQLGERRVHELSALQTRARCCNFGSRWARSTPASQPQPPWQHARPFPKAGAQLPFSLPAIWMQKPPAAAGGCISRWGPFRHGQVLSWGSNSARSPMAGSEGQPRGRSNGALVLPEPPQHTGRW